MIKKIRTTVGITAAVCMFASCMPAFAADNDDGLVLWYGFDEVNNAQTVKDISGNGNDGIVYGEPDLEYGRIHFDGEDDYIKMPDGLLENTESVTVAINTCPEQDTIHQFTWNFGNSSSTGYMFLNTSRPDSKLRFAITPTDFGGEQALESDQHMVSGEWGNVIVTIDGAEGKMYRDGMLVAESELEMDPSDLGKTVQNWIGRSPYGDAMYKGYIEDFRVYDKALSAAEVKELSDEYKSELDDELTKALVESGIKNVVKEDLVLPAEAGGAQITWSTSDSEHISEAGKVTRPPLGADSVKVTLTASISKDGETSEESFEITVPPEGGGTYALNISGEKGAEISDTMVGLFFEDINYAADGGLYAEMVENRSFESTYVDNKTVEKKYDGGWSWYAYPEDASGSVMDYKTESPLNQNNTHYLEFTPSADQTGFANRAYDGLALKKGMVYNGSFYARAYDYKGGITVSAVKDGVTYGEAKIEGITDEWAKYSFEITASEDVRGAQLVINMDGNGTLDFDMISLIPDDAVNGVFRRDLAEMLKAIDPGFLRFPGGCIIEGYDLDNRYNWKNSVGPVEERKENWNRWDLHTDGYNHYNQTMGIGFFEFFELCEYLECEAVPVVNAGMACQFQTNELVPIESEEFGEYIQDALDLIEFANGGTDTEWGALRAEMGHPEPFNIKMIGVGNEQWNTEENRFRERYELFEKAIHEVYPEIGIIGTSGPDVTSGNYSGAWEWIKEKYAENDNFVYAVDEHYYMIPDWFLQNTDFYDDYDRDIKVFAGEYASRTRNKPNDPEANTLYTALTEAAYFTGLERNADVVIMSCYAPLFARVGYTQWSPDLIWFDDASAYGSPSYYVQKMNGNNLGDYTVVSETAEGSNNTGMYSNVSYDEAAKELIIKLVNVTEDTHYAKFDIDGYSVVSDSYTVQSIGGNDPEASNSIETPELVTDKTESAAGASNSFSYEIAPYTYAILRIKAEKGAELSDMLNKEMHVAFIDGRTDTEFVPEGSLTRAELMTMLARVTKGYDPQASYTSSFTDVADDAWYADVIGFMADKGVVEGYEDGSFKPDKAISVTEFKAVSARLGYICGLDDSAEPITRAEAVKQLCGVLGRMPTNETLNGITGVISFTDVAAENEYYIYIMEAANTHTYDIVNGSEVWNAMG